MWSKKFKECIECGSSDKKHIGNGRCVTCHARYAYHNYKGRKKQAYQALKKWRENNRDKYNAIQKRVRLNAKNKK